MFVSQYNTAYSHSQRLDLIIKRKHGGSTAKSKRANQGKCSIDLDFLFYFESLDDCSMTVSSLTINGQLSVQLDGSCPENNNNGGPCGS